ISGDIRGPGGIHGDRRAPIVERSAEIRAVHNRAARGIQLGGKSVLRPSESRLKCAQRRKISGSRRTGNVSRAARIDGNTIAAVSPRPAQIGAVDQRRSGRIQFGYERVPPASICCLRRYYYWAVGGTRIAGE